MIDLVLKDARETSMTLRCALAHVFDQLANLRDLDKLIPIYAVRSRIRVSSTTDDSVLKLRL